ncbi:helix-turn-helix domain-containing protein [Streptococcus iniae]
MLDHYIERSITDKKQLLSLLFDKTTVSMTELVDKTKLTPATIKQYIEDLNHCFSDQLTISIKQQVISCQYPQALKDNYLHDLYAESKILQLLKFLILNAQAQKPLTYFAEKTFISNASAYRSARSY